MLSDSQRLPESVPRCVGEGLGNEAIRSYRYTLVCLLRSPGPIQRSRSACCARDSLAHEEAGLTLPKGFLAQTPENQPPVFVAQDRQNQPKNKLRPTVHSPVRFVKEEIVALWPFVGGFPNRLSRGIGGPV